MGMDVFGRGGAPEGAPGHYFRNNVWWWRPLADYCCRIAPEVTASCSAWQSNDGEGLNAEASIKLAQILQREVDSGRTKQEEVRWEADMAALPDDPCKYCNQTGIRHWADGAKTCNACEGQGHSRPSATWYHFSEENVKEWIEFLTHCGGFEIL